MRALMAAGIAVAFAGCSANDQVTTGKVDEPETTSRTQEPGTDGSRAVTASETPGPVIVTIRSRSGTLTAHASEVGPLFTIAKEDGVVEAEGLSYVELQDRYPSYYRAIRSSIATDGRLYADLYHPDADGTIRIRDLDTGTGKSTLLDARRVSPAEDKPKPLLHADW